MKNSFRVVFTTAFLLVATLCSFAQKKGSRDHDPAKRADHQTARMVENLSLNDKQAIEVKAINLSYAKQMKDAHIANKGKDREAIKAIKTDLKKERSAELAKVLTSSQLEVYQANKEKVREKRDTQKRMSPAERAELRTNRMVEKLSLDQTQTAQVKAINLDYANKIKAGYEANKGKDRDVLKAMKDNLDKGKAIELKKVLTPAQFKTYEELNAKRSVKRKNGKRPARS